MNPSTGFDFSVREYEWLLHQYIFCKYWAKLFCLANRHLSGQHGGVEVVACTRTTHSRDTVGGGSGALLVQGLSSNDLQPRVQQTERERMAE